MRRDCSVCTKRCGCDASRPMASSLVHTHTNVDFHCPYFLRVVKSPALAKLLTLSFVCSFVRSYNDGCCVKLQLFYSPLHHHLYTNHPKQAWPKTMKIQKRRGKKPPPTNAASNACSTKLTSRPNTTKASQTATQQQPAEYKGLRVLRRGRRKTPAGHP